MFVPENPHIRFIKYWDHRKCSTQPKEPKRFSSEKGFANARRKAKSFAGNSISCRIH